MTENNTPVLTREQARFLLDLELDTYAKKARAIAKAARELTFSDQWDEDNFHDAIRQGYWDVQTDYYFINILAPLGQVGFISQTEFSHPITAKPVYDVTDDFTKATRFPMEELEDLNSSDTLFPYNQAEFLVSEYSAVMKYGDITEWLKQTDEEVAEVSPEVAEVEIVGVPQAEPSEETVEEVAETLDTDQETVQEEKPEEKPTNVKHGKAQISLKLK